MVTSADRRRRATSAEGAAATGVGIARAWPLVATLCAAQVVTVFDFNTVAVALPAIGHGLGFSAEALQWVVGAYALVFGGFLLLAGRVADLYGRRRVLAGGLALLALTALAAALAPTPPTLLLARAAQGLGAAVAVPTALAALTATFADERARARALSVWFAAGAGGSIVGVLLGGVVTGALGWRGVFAVEVPLATLGAALTLALLPAGAGRGRAAPPLDTLGAVAATAGLTALVYGLTRVRGAGLGDPLTRGALALALALLAAFVAVEARAADPLVPLRLFRARPPVGALLVALVLAATTNPPVYFGTLYLQRAMGRSPAETGLTFLPIYVAIAAGALLGPRLVARIGARATMVASMGTVVVGLLLLAALSSRAVDLGPLIAGFVLEGAGLGCTSVAGASVLTAAVGAERQGLASGLLNVAGQVGTALGLAALVAIAAARTAALAGSSGPSRAALVAGFQGAFLASAALALVAAFAALALVRDPRR